MSTTGFTYLSDDLHPAGTFFRPRVVREEYDKGWQGKRTLVLGPHQWCAERGTNERCPHKFSCCSETGIQEMDDRCPEYAPRGHRLSDGNRAEIDIFLDPPSYALYADHTCFTRLMMDLNHKPTKEERHQFWDRVAFHNLLQHYVPEKREFPYSQDAPESEYLQSFASYAAMYDAARPSFVHVIEALAPEVIYVWSEAACNALKAFEIDGLTCQGLLCDGNGPIVLPNTGMKIYVFTYNSEFSTEILPKNIRNSFKIDDPYKLFDEDVRDRLREYIMLLNCHKDEFKARHGVITFIILDTMMPGRLEDKNFWKLLVETTPYDADFDCFRSAKREWLKDHKIFEPGGSEKIKKEGKTISIPKKTDNLTKAYKETLGWLGISEDVFRKAYNTLPKKT